jgi:uncharacterized protein
MTKRIRHLCRDMDTTFHASVTTNGLLLTSELGASLVEAGITNVQVTLDGPPEIHDKRRALRSGAGSFDRIWTNILSNSETLAVSIRINVDAENLQSLNDLHSVMKRHGLADNAYLARTNYAIASCKDISACHVSAEMPMNEFAELQINGLGDSHNLWSVKQALTPRTSFCAGPTLRLLVIDPLGRLFKCWQSVGNSDQSIGSIFFKEKLPLNPVHIKWLTYSPLNNAECRSCRVLPLCMGGCPQASLFQAGDRTPQCSPVRYNLDAMIRLLYRQSEKRVKSTLPHVGFADRVKAPV